MKSWQTNNMWASVHPFPFLCESFKDSTSKWSLQFFFFFFVTVPKTFVSDHETFCPTFFNPCTFSQEMSFYLFWPFLFREEKRKKKYISWSNSVPTYGLFV